MMQEQEWIRERIMKAKPAGTGVSAGKATGKKAGAGKEKRPVVRTAKHVVRLLQNKVIGSLLLCGQGILFLVSPSGDVTPTIRISAGLILLACLLMVFFHLVRGKRSKLDIAVAVISGILMVPAAYFLFRPGFIKPFVRIVVGVITIITALINLIETLKIKNKKDWKFIVSLVGVLAIAALGIFMIAAGEEEIAVMQRSIGAILILNAVVNIWYIIQLHREIKKAGQPKQGAQK